MRALLLVVSLLLACSSREHDDCTELLMDLGIRERGFCDDRLAFATSPAFASATKHVSRRTR